MVKKNLFVTAFDMSFIAEEAYESIYSIIRDDIVSKNTRKFWW